MAELIHTEDYEYPNYGSSAQINIYCGLDCCVTLECDAAHEELHDAVSRKTLAFSERAGVLALCLSLRGLRVDEGERAKLALTINARKTRMEALLNRFARVVWNQDLNPRSYQQLQEFFYSTMRVPPVVERFKGVERVTTNRKALEKIAKHSIHAKLFVNCILFIRDLSKTLGVLHGGVDSDGRMRFSFNPAGTETGRWSSRKNPMGGGTNAQNITDELRRIFIPDEGYFFAYVDLKSAESIAVGFYSGDEDYIKACLTGDVHSAVVEMIWPGQNPKAPYYRHFSHRDITKRLGHASNYYGTPFGIAQQVAVDKSVIATFQQLYFRRFPGIKRWHLKVAQELQQTRRLTNIFGRRRQFFGRPYEDETLREAIANLPQSTVADYANEGILRVFETFDRGDPNADVKVASQLHDAGLFQVRLGKEHLVREIQRLMSFPVSFGTRTMTIPTDAEVGFNFSKQSAENPNGLGKSLEGKTLKLGSILETVF